MTSRLVRKQHNNVRIVSVLFAVLTPLLFACAPDSESQAKPEQVPPDDAIARLALESLPSLRASQLFRDWKASNPGDSIKLHGPQFEFHEDDAWCARATKTLKLDSLTIVRSAYFFPPPPDDPLVLPVDQSPEQLTEQCRLEFFVIDFVQTDSLRARAHKTEIRRALSVGLGPADDITNVAWWGSGNWSNRSSWRGKDVSVVAATTGAKEFSEGSAGDSTRVFVLGFGNAFGRIDPRDWGPGDLEFDLDEAHQRQGPARLEETMVSAALGGEAERQIRAIISRGPREFNDAGRDTFATALEKWLTDARQLPPPRHAAALLVADQLLGAYDGVLNLLEPDQKALRDRFAAYGAEFDLGGLDAAYVNTHTWVKQALDLDPSGRAGDVAFLILIGMGFDTSAECAVQDRFRTVIARGEQYLRDRPASSISRDVHLMVARAYTDIWTLANGGGYEGAITAKEYLAEAPAARLRAIEEYRAALSGVPRTPDARESWIDAWRVMAGLTPMRTFFYCIYD